MTTFILIPGAWLGGWVWEPVVRGLRERGHTAHAMTFAQRATYIACTRAGHWASDDVAAMRTERNWTFRTLDAGHWPMVSVPAELVAMLDQIAHAATPR
jgi:hypothetical protein